MPRLSLGLGASSSSKLPSAAAPSGIPVASTNSIIVTNPLYAFGFSFTFNKQGTPPNIYYEFEVWSINWFSVDNVWAQLYNDPDNSFIEYNESASQNQNFIPTTGWPSGTTITAA